MAYWLLRFHRWIALAFALPLLVVIATGFILAFEPWLVVASIKPSTLTAASVQSLLTKHDPDGKARALAVRSYDGTITIGRRDTARTIDIASGNVMASPSRIAGLLSTSRRLHETLLLDAGWLVLASSISMLVLAVLGVLMGWPRFANTVAGWHKGVSWGLLPLLVLSPLTGVMLATGVTLTANRFVDSPKDKPIKLAEAVRVVAAKHDLSNLVSLRVRGGRMVARIVDGGEFRNFQVTSQGAFAAQRNWPRLWHEGNFAGRWSALMNVITSAAMLALLATGLWIWLRRKLRRPQRQRLHTA